MPTPVPAPELFASGAHATTTKRDSTTLFTAPFVLVVPDRAQNSAQELTYGVPEKLRDDLQIGCAVLVQVGAQTVTGYVSGFIRELDFDAKKLKPITRLLDPNPVLDKEAIQVARWMSSYYHVPLSDCVCCWVPQGSRQESVKKFTFVEEIKAAGEAALKPLFGSPRRFQIARFLLHCDRAMTTKEIQKIVGGADVRAVLKSLVADGFLVETESDTKAQIKTKTVLAIRRNADRVLDVAEMQIIERKSPKQAIALSALTENFVAVSAFSKQHEVDPSVLRALEKKGLAQFGTLEIRRDPTAQLPAADTQAVQFTPEQKTAANQIETILKRAIASGKSETVLLQGVTASGKTEVYLDAIEHCLQLGKRAIVLVPEIALTTQTVEIFQRRFRERVAILHSALGAGERFDEWHRARRGEADIVVGARSAVFAPCENLGLIVIDEEHDGSYKQDSPPRYHARDVAMKRASLSGAVVLLGSATPSLETYTRAVKGDYAHLKMTKRVGNRPLPAVEIVDMTVEAKMGSVPVLSTRLKNALCETLARGEQAILFLNRRGFAVYVQCLGCGHVERCPNCDVALTFHRGEKSLRCHHCDHSASVIETCPECEGWMIGFSGTGTEKVENEVADLLAKNGLRTSTILRLDRDTTSRKGSHANILNEFRAGRASVLIGTQMVTKGLDFPNVTLVGVIAADSALNMPDFRAAERTFQLLAQVAGRAGRGQKAGRVLIQALATDHYAIAAARSQDYEAFAKEESEYRRNPCYPPFSHIVNIISQDEDEKVAKQKLDELAVAFAESIARENGDSEHGTELLGPVDCPVSRIKNKFRFHLLLRDRNRPRLHRVLDAFDKLPRASKTGLIVDVDASSLL